MQIVIVRNIAKVSKAIAPPTSVVGPLSVMSSHCTMANAAAVPAVIALNIAYQPFGHFGVSAPSSMMPSDPASSVSIGDRANQPTSGTDEGVELGEHQSPSPSVSPSGSPDSETTPISILGTGCT